MISFNQFDLSYVVHNITKQLDDGQTEKRLFFNFEFIVACQKLHNTHAKCSP